MYKLRKNIVRKILQGLVYWGTGKNRYQIQFPSELKASLDQSWVLTSSAKGVVRYRSFSPALVAKLFQ